MIITKRSILYIVAAFAILGLLLTGPRIVKSGQRYLYGVKAGVTLEGQSVGRLLEEELYDVVASLAETSFVEARNASHDWRTGTIIPEVVGQLVDIQSTVDALLSANPRTEVSLVLVPILPSITSAYFQAYYRGPAEEPRVALMINVDWGNEFIPGMLAVLKQADVSATWFPTGRWVGVAPDLAKAIAEAGHELGNHGGWHGMASKMNRDEVTRLIKEGEDQILQATGQKPQIFAPPAGDYNAQTVVVAAELGYKTVLWTVDTVDWQRPPPTLIVDRVISKVNNGALVLMHPTKPTLEALPVIIDHLKTKGYQLVTVSELLAE